MCNEGQGGCVVFERVCDRLESFDWMLGARTRSDVSATVHRNEPGSDKASAREGPFRHFLETILEQRCAGCNYAYVCRPAGIAFFLFLFYPRCGEEGGGEGYCFACSSAYLDWRWRRIRKRVAARRRRGSGPPIASYATNVESLLQRRAVYLARLLRAGLSRTDSASCG